MKILLVAFVFATASADNYCKGLFLKDDYYTADIIKDSVNRVHQLAYNKNDNTAYFTFEDIAQEPTTYLGYVDLEPPRHSGVINDTKNAKGVAVDQKLNKIYIGGSNGLYVIDKNNNITEKLAVNDDIENIFLKDVIYYVNSKKQAYKFDFNTIEQVPELKNVSVDKLVVSDNDIIFFLKGNKLFRVKIGDTEIVSVGSDTVYDIATNYKFKPYITTKLGFFVYNSSKNSFDKIAVLTDIKKLAFVNDNEPLYVVVDTIVKLVHEIPCLGD